MKKIIIVLIGLIFLSGLCVYAEEMDVTIPRENIFNSTLEEIKSASFDLKPDKIFTYIIDQFIKELKDIKILILSVFAIALTSGVLNVMENSKSVSNTSFFVCYCLMTGACAKIISICVGYGSSVINSMCDFVTKLAPILSMLLITSGYTASASAFYPVLAVTVFVVCKIVDGVIIPLIYISSVIGIVNNLSGKSQLSSFNKLIKSFSKWLLTAILTIFSGINAIYGFCTPTIDSVGMKTAKFAIGSIVPVVGGFLSDSVETVMGSARLVKNAAGTAGIISIISICAVPVIKLLAIVFILKISQALIEPLSDKRFSQMLGEVASQVTTVFALLFVVTVLFILSVAIIISSTNIAL